MSILENPPENPCFGCGPLHPRGLHLILEEDHAADGVHEVRTRFTPKPDEIGWPGLQHGGLHYFVLHEVSYWAALTLGGKVMRFSGTAQFHQERLPRVGIEHVARARIAAREEMGGLAIRAESRTATDRQCGVLDTHWLPASRAEVERARLALPNYLLEEMDP
ncbi:MAG: hypothetical protein ACREB9_08420 [Thermoplasmata archaeon]